MSALTNPADEQRVREIVREEIRAFWNVASLSALRLLTEGDDPLLKAAP